MAKEGGTSLGQGSSHGDGARPAHLRYADSIAESAEVCWLPGGATVDSLPTGFELHILHGVDRRLVQRVVVPSKHFAAAVPQPGHQHLWIDVAIRAR